jgi:hypothetical protein
MPHPKVSQKRAKNLSAALFLVGLAIVCLGQNIWPAIMLVIGLPLSLRQYLLGRTYDSILSLTVFVLAFAASGLDISWHVILPIIFIIGSLYLLIREFCDPYQTTEAEDEESLSYEIEEDEDEDKN